MRREENHPGDGPAGGPAEGGPAAPEAVAIVGIGALYPGARGPGQFWELIGREKPGNRGFPGPDRTARDSPAGDFSARASAVHEFAVREGAGRDAESADLADSAEAERRSGARGAGTRNAASPSRNATGRASTGRESTGRESTDGGLPDGGSPGPGLPDGGSPGRAVPRRVFPEEIFPDRPGTLDDIPVDVARFGIPPAQAGAMARMQLLMLEAAHQCLSDAGHPERPLPAARTDVVTGTCFALDRQHANATRIEAGRYAREVERAAVAQGVDAATARAAAEELRARVARLTGASPHDRVGEMASTVPARIATAFRLHGRTLAVEAADATSFLALDHAVHNLRRGVSDAVLVVAGQQWESPVVTGGLRAKGRFAEGAWEASEPGATGTGEVPGRAGEGVGALLLKRLSTALRDGDRIYAEILDSRLRHDPRPGAFRPSRDAGLRRSLARESLRAAGADPASVTHVECVDSAERTGGGVRDRLGDTFANAGLAAVTGAALALHHRRNPAGAGQPSGEEPSGEGGAAPRRAVVRGSSLTGTVCHLVLQEHRRNEETAARAPGAPRPAHAPRQGHTPRTPSSLPEPIAVVALAGRFAGAADAETFWKVTASGETRIGPVPETVLERDLYHAPGALSLTHSYTDQGGHVPVPEGPYGDARIVPVRRAAMDDTQRLALAVAAELFQGRGGPAARAARPAGGLAGRGIVAIGTNLGLTRERRAHARAVLRAWDGAVADLTALDGLPPQRKAALRTALRDTWPANDEPTSPAALDGCLAGGVAALLANEYRLDAVPLGVEAACASSLAALDVCVGALRQGTADFAVTGGVELACTTRDMVLCSALGLLSHSRNAPFDREADGFTPGDGCGLFLLKRYEDARADGDEILGLVRGIGASNDAKSLIAPDLEGQLLAMRRAFAEAGFGPAAVDYLEAHGTGTKVGDRIEIAAAGRMYGSERRARPLRIGSAKSFFGHTFAAAGSAGLLRTLLAMRAGTLPPNANLRTLNPALGLDAVPAVVDTRPSPWTRQPGRPRRAAVSSFGTGGINYHVLVEEHLDGAS
ncbi:MULTISPECIES: polyketide synthase [unclassified Streptomyces]|nr:MULTISPECIES: polyketide synthase [unclassified Streptomyces]MCF0085427.1 Beta-ketoacyl synthase PigJ [Streptomyces sp. MH192]MCF0097861.1 Beta-ketoacyl synthase PigJ [Streptomyces sp. MH191]